MRIKTAADINARTHDGRAFTAAADSVEEIDDEDAGMVGLAKVLITSGQAEHYGDVGTVDEGVALEEETGEADPVIRDLASDDDATDEDD